jgi:glycosyltransferase involved in cell wall biosynthesis
MILNVLFWIFVTVVAIQFLYYIVVFGKFSFVKAKKNNLKKIPISVIVCAKNEAENVAKFIPLLAQQNYPDFEIILIDDASSDETSDIFEAFEQEYSTIIKLVKVANNEAFWGNKKFALTLGIKAATKEYLLFTDADCYPTTSNWITEMSSHFTMQKTIVLGYGAFEKVPKSFLNKIIRFETLLTAVQYFSWARIGKPFMGIGRNMAYKKEEFFNVNGFIDHMKILSGADDLFINQAANRKNTTVCYTQDSFTYSEAKTNYSEWFTQKRRHATTRHYYKKFDQLQLGLFFLTQILTFLLPIILLVFQFQWIAVIGLVVFRYLFSWISLGFGAVKLNEKDVMFWFPIIEIVLIFTQLNIMITNLFSKPVHWK